MLLYGIFYALRLDANVPLCCGGAAVLKQSLDQDDVIAVGFVDLSGIPLAEAVGADALISQVIADDPQLLLNHPLCYGKYGFSPSNAISQTVVLDVLVEHQGHSEDSALACFLLHNL